MKTFCRTLKLSRSGYYARKQRIGRARIPRKNEMSDACLLTRIKALIVRWTTYGYRRITALLQRDTDAPRVNHKRVYRVMKENGLLHRKHPRRPTETHDGKVATLKSDVRWCSDVFRLQCSNGEHVEVLFALDCCDREIISWLCTTGGINSSCVQDLVVDCVSARFGNSLPHRIQWLTDNGSCYVSKQTVCFLRGMGFDVCTTRPYSPESNGMAEAFVKTFKRDYAYVSDLTSADVVINRLSGWFEEYNSFAPHKALGMKSPREYRSLKQAG